MSADITSALVAFLKADGPLAALVDARVYGVELPLAEASLMPRSACVVQPSGGSTLTEGTYVALTGQRFDVFSYGETPFEVEKVRRAVYDALKALRRSLTTGVLIHWCDPAGGFANLRDPDTTWPINFQSFQAFYAETAVI